MSNLQEQDSAFKYSTYQAHAALAACDCDGVPLSHLDVSTSRGRDMYAAAEEGARSFLASLKDADPERLTKEYARLLAKDELRAIAKDELHMREGVVS